MLPEYKTVYRGGEGEITEKKSRFIANVVPVSSEEEAEEFIESMKKKILGCKAQLLCLYHRGAGRDKEVQR